MIYFLNIILFYILTVILTLITYKYLVIKISIRKRWVALALFIMMCFIIISNILFRNKYGFNSYSITCIFLIYILFIITIHDLIYKRIPLEWLILGGVIGSFMLFNNPNISILEGIGGSIIIGVILFLMSKVTRGGIGMGDALVFAFISLIVGWRMAITVLILALVLSGCIGIVLFVFKKASRKTTIPFMPFIFTVTIFILWI